MCLKPHTTRRFCVKCKMVTAWKVDRKINHSRCLVCGSDSRFAKKPKKSIYEEPKMNKQYVKEQIDIAINELRKEYDAVIGNIYQCPDCGAVAFKNSEHICFKAAAAEPTAPAKTSTAASMVLNALPIGAPAIDIELFDTDSPYTPHKIAAMAKVIGYTGSFTSLKVTLGTLWKAGKISRRPAVIKSEGRRKSPDGLPGFVYWRRA